MSSDSSAVVSASGIEAPGGIGLWGALFVSYVANPLVLPPVVYGTALAHVGAPPLDVGKGVGIAVVFLVLMPLAYVGWMRAQGHVASLEIRDRTKRTGPFLVVLGAGVAAFAAVLGTELVGQRLLAALVGYHVVNTGLLGLITMRWKISVHCASVAGAVATLAFLSVHVPGRVLRPEAVGHVEWMGGIGLVVLVLWARIRSRAHTPSQAVAGTVLGLAPYLELLAVARTLGL